MADKIPCAWGDNRPTLTVTGRCISGGCDDFSATLKPTEDGRWDGNMPNGDLLTFGWSGGGTQNYVLSGGPPEKPYGADVGGTFRCQQDGTVPFKYVSLNWGPDNNGCVYEVTITPDVV